MMESQVLHLQHELVHSNKVVLNCLMSLFELQQLVFCLFLQHGRHKEGIESLLKLAVEHEP